MNNNPLEWLSKLHPASKAGTLGVVLIAFGLSHEIGGFGIEPDMGHVALVLGVCFSMIWLLLLFKPPPEQRRRESDEPEDP